MGLRRTPAPHVRCDGEGCLEVSDYFLDTLFMERTLLEWGWENVLGIWLCPHCSEFGVLPEVEVGLTNVEWN